MNEQRIKEILTGITLVKDFAGIDKDKSTGKFSGKVSVEKIGDLADDEMSKIVKRLTTTELNYCVKKTLNTDMRNTRASIGKAKLSGKVKAVKNFDGVKEIII